MEIWKIVYIWPRLQINKINLTHINLFIPIIKQLKDI